mmetsp:Transcript_21928/g.23536  ORF Transcript_21928/g.23536 Transcript_21928/m.23536 type:complete len:99 (-) Transcript_21928:309-605(-)
MPPLPPSPSVQKNLTNVLTSVASPPPFLATATIISPDKTPTDNEGNDSDSSSYLLMTSTNDNPSHGDVLISGSDPSQVAAGAALATTGGGLDEGIPLP